MKKLKKRLLPIWWFTRRLLGSSKLRPFDPDKWLRSHADKYQKDWEEFCTRSPEEQEHTLKDRIDQLAAVSEELKSISGRAALLGTIAAAVLAADIFFIKDGNPSLMWMVKVAFVPLALNFFLLLLIASPSFGSIYKRYISASDWQRLISAPQDRYTRLMMLLDRYSDRTDRLKAHQIRATMLLITGGIPLGAALIFR
jgi:hypothetical protein